MTTPWRKAIRDFWRERTRTLLVVMAIAIGIAASGAVLSSWAILTRELDRGYRATNPASAILETDAIDAGLLDAIAARPGIGAAEASREVAGRLQAGTGPWLPLTLFVSDGFDKVRIGTLKPEQGAWPPATGEILIERDAFQVAGVRIGDSVTVRTAHGQEQRLRITGSVHDVGQAQARMEHAVYGYIDMATLARLGEQTYRDQLKLVVAEDPLDERHIRSIAAGMAKWLESQGHPVRRVDVPRPGKHPHSDIMGVLLLAMASFGLFVSALGGLLVVNLTTALMAAQIRQIGVMQATGGSRLQIAGIYLAQALFLGVTATAIGLPGGMVGGRVLCRALAGFLNFDITSFAVPVWVYLLVATVGLLVPLLAAAHPVWRGCSVSVRQALSDHGESAGGMGAVSSGRGLWSAVGCWGPFTLALRASLRRRARLLRTLMNLTAAGVFFMSALDIRASVLNTLDHLFATRCFDLSVNLGTMYPYSKVEEALRSAPGVARAEGWVVSDAELPVNGAASDASNSESFPVFAVPPASAFTKREILSGRDLRPGDTDAVVVTTALVARHAQLKPGTSMALSLDEGTTAWRIVGVAREAFSPPAAYISRGYFDNRSPGNVNSVRIVLEKTDAASVETAKADVERSLEAAGIRPRSIRSKADSRIGFDEHLSMICIFLVVMACILAGVGGLGLTSTMSLSAMERRHEIGVMRALGASQTMIAQMLIIEGVLIGMMAWALAAVAAGPFSRCVGDFIVEALFKSRLNTTSEPAGRLIWLVASLLLGSVASVLAARRAMQADVRQALDSE